MDGGLSSQDYLLARLVLRHYWVWLAFTTEHVSESQRYNETRRAFDALGAVM
jgi:hypothetical protein